MNGNVERGGRGAAERETAERLPPNAPEAEAGVLGCCMLDPECIGDTIEALVSDEAFYDLRYRVVWQHLRRLYEAKKKPDAIVLQESLKASGELDQVGGLMFVLSLPDQVPSAANLPFYLDLVREKWLARRMILACVQTVNEIYGADGKRTMDDLLAAAEQRVQQASEVRVAGTEKTLKEVMQDVTENVLEKFRRGHKFRIGPATGFNYLDNILPGLAPGQLIVLAARPRTGKSAFVMQVAEHVAMKEGDPVGIFSLEMTARSLGLREIFQNAGADLTKFMNGFLIDDDVRKLTLAGARLTKAPIIIDESPRMSIEDLEVRARRFRRKHGVKLLIVDYFQLLYCRNPRSQWSKSDELADISMRLKALAKELQIPVVLCAQMNRQIEQDVNRRPRLSDLKDTGQLEQDSDVVMFLWKKSIDLENSNVEARIRDVLRRVPCPEEWKTWERNEDGKTWKHYLGMIQCTVEKQREGRSGEDAAMVFIKPWTRFVDAYNPPKEKAVKESGNERQSVERDERASAEQQVLVND